MLYFLLFLLFGALFLLRCEVFDFARRFLRLFASLRRDYLIGHWFKRWVCRESRPRLDDHCMGSGFIGIPSGFTVA